MQIEKLTILGCSRGALTMIFDNLNSQELWPLIEIVDNLGVLNLEDVASLGFDIGVIDAITESSGLFLGVYRPATKKEVFDCFMTNMDDFVNIIHSSSQISRTTKLGRGCLINSLVSIAGASKIGDFVSVNRNVSIGHHVIIEDFVSINPGVNIAGFVKIGEGSTIGMGANIIDGVTIGKNSIIGAGSTVTKDIPDNVVAYGSPCKPI